MDALPATERISLNYSCFQAVYNHKHSIKGWCHLEKRIALAKNPENKESDPAAIKRVAVIGAGLMGHGIAQVFARGGCSVTLCDNNENVLRTAKDNVRSNLELCVEMGLENETIVDTVLSRIKITTNLRDAVREAEFVTEAVFEDLSLKKEIFKEIDALTNENVIMASNTSGLSITEIGKVITKSDRLLITHWFNPPHLIPVVEVLKLESPTEEAFNLTFNFLKRMGKEPVHVLKEVPGFLVNRIQTAMFREIVSLLEAGVAGAEDLDKAVQGSFGLRLAAVGPLATVDLAGVDLWYKGAKNLYPVFDVSQEPQKLLTEMVEKGFHGIKTGKGFFDYQADSKTDIIKDRDMKLIKLLKNLYHKQNKP
jgi:3-hydroxyacyl-CoA dehydrogenase